MDRVDARRNDSEPIDQSRRAKSSKKQPEQDQEKQVLNRQRMLQERKRKLMRRKVESRQSCATQGVPQGQNTLFIGVPTGRSGHGADTVSEAELLQVHTRGRVIRRKSFLVRVACRRSRSIIASLAQRKKRQRATLS